MNAVIQQLNAELELWKPQRQGLLKLDSTLSAIRDLRAPVDDIAAAVPGRIRFDTGFPSFCFAIATGCGKTRLMGACIAYLYQTRGYRNFFILTPGDTIYRKTIANFTPHHPKYVLKGYTDLPDFTLVTGENYDRQTIGNRLIADELAIYVFNIQKIFNPRQDLTFRFHRFRETLGSSFANILRAKNDLVILMDESHRYRGPESLKAMNDLCPLLGLEFTATPAFSGNVIYEYPLGQAVEEGLVKTLVVVGRKGQRAYKGEIEEIKLHDGLERHRRKKALLEAYCHNEGLPSVRPLVLISGADTAHAEALKRQIETDDFLDGAYKGRVIRTHSKMGADDADIERLVQLENDPDVEIVIHVNKLKEGWDVKNVYTIIPLRASVSDILTEQTIGRGLRLPFGNRTGEEELDTLEIIAHDRYAEVIQRVRQHQQQYGYAFKTLDLDERPPTPTEVRDVIPQSDSPYEIVIPRICARPHVHVGFDAFAIKPRKEFAMVDVEIVKTALTKDAREEFLAHAPLLEDQEPVAYLTRILLTDAPMLKPEHYHIISQLVRDYLTALSPDAAQWRAIVTAHAGDIFDDIVGQIDEHLQAATTITYEAEAGYIPFRAWKKTVPEGYTPKHKDAVLDEDCNSSEVITGYQKTIFTENVFDSRQEKWFADILDADDEVQQWVRLTRGQLEIFYGGGDYNPDFVVETADCIYLIEIKRSDEVNDEQVLAKARRGVQWCQAASQVGPKAWQYRLIAHDDVHQGDSFAAVISRAVRL